MTTNSLSLHATNKVLVTLRSSHYVFLDKSSIDLSMTSKSPLEKAKFSIQQAIWQIGSIIVDTDSIAKRVR